MPSSTFFRLPEEKRTRLVNAAWEEFTQVKFADVSINRIIQNAHIPRGSFYQYFQDKEDLFTYLLNEIRSSFLQTLRSALVEVDGNLFDLPIYLFDHFLKVLGGQGPILARSCSIFKVNPGWDIKNLIGGGSKRLPEDLLEHIDLSRLRRQDTVYVEQVLSILLVMTGSTVAETMLAPEQLEQQRQLLQLRVDIVRLGSDANAENIRTDNAKDTAPDDLGNANVPKMEESAKNPK
jgi:AcrR family transcriptional regulator